MSLVISRPDQIVILITHALFVALLSSHPVVAGIHMRHCYFYTPRNSVYVCDDDDAVGQFVTSRQQRGVDGASSVGRKGQLSTLY